MDINKLIHDTNKLLMEFLWDEAPYDVRLEEENYVYISWSDEHGDHVHYGIASPPLICLVRRDLQS